MAVIATNQVDVLAAVVTRLKAAVTELDGDSLCYVSDYPAPPENVQNDLFATVSPSDGTFDVDLQEGAAANDVREYAGILVTVFSKMKLDRHGRTDSLLSDSTRGLLPLKRKILKALAGHRLQDGSSNDLTTSYLYAQKASAPRWDADTKLGVMSLYFSTDFLWDLTT